MLETEGRPDERLEREMEVDLAFVDNIRHTLPDAQAAYQAHGRGTVIFDLRTESDGISYSVSYAPIDLIPNSIRGTVLRLVETYDPEIEFIVTFFRGDTNANVYRVRPLDDVF